MKSRGGDSIPVEDLVRSAMQGLPKEDWDYLKQDAPSEYREKCSNCRFVGPLFNVSVDGTRKEADNAYECRLNPPVPTIDWFNGLHTEWEYPRVHGEAWCGQYEPRKSDENL